MALNAGDRIGPYEILGPLGKGGMGEVYRGRDTKLGREVAIKILPTAFAQFPDRLIRFEREAKVLAKLNHPNIATIYTVEDSSEGKALVMELVPGAPIRGPLPVPQAVKYAIQIASAIEAAHEQGVIHRDLKPGNIMLTPDGVVKVLDFGLAAVAQPAPEDGADGETAATLTLSPTRAGTILGTAPYMSPEQAVGRIVDARTDIFSFGAVLYELVTGQRAFPGTTTPDILEAVVRNDPDWTKLPTGRIERLVRRCLEKDRKQRLQAIGEARIALEQPEAATPMPAVPKSRAWVWPTAVAAVLAGALIFVLWRSAPSTPMLSARTSIILPAGQEFTSYPAITRDGQTIAYAAQQGSEDAQLYLRDINSYEARVVPNSKGAKQPFFSPDGKWIAFFTQGRIYKAAVAGGAPTAIGNAPGPFGGTWTDDNSIIYSPSLNSGLERISANGGAPVTIAKPDGGANGFAYIFPQTLPGEKNLAFSRWGQGQGVAILPITSGGSPTLAFAPGEIMSARVATDGGQRGRWIFTGKDGIIRVATFHPERATEVKPDAAIMSDVFFDWEVENGPWIDVSRTGTAVYVAASTAKVSLQWVDIQGNATPLGQGPDSFREVRLSPSGTKAVVRIGALFWVFDLQRNTRVKLAAPQSSSNYWPTWSPDSSKIIFGSSRSGNWEIYTQLADGSAPAEVLLERPFDQFPQSVAADGTILYMENHPKTGRDLWILTPDGKASPVRVTPNIETSGQFAPSAGAPNKLAYISDESGRFEVYVQSLTGSANRVPISTGGGHSPVWSRDGHILYYLSGDAVMAVDGRADGSFSAPRRVFDRREYYSRFNSNAWDIAPDGKHFLMIHRDEGSVPNRLNVIFNWFAELDRTVPLPK